MTAEIEITVETELRGRLARKLVREAAERNMRPVDLLASIVEIVLENDLVQAVIDD